MDHSLLPPRGEPGQISRHPLGGTLPRATSPAEPRFLPHLSNASLIRSSVKSKMWVNLEKWSGFTGSAPLRRASATTFSGVIGLS